MVLLYALSEVESRASTVTVLSVSTFCIPCASGAMIYTLLAESIEEISVLSIEGSR